MEQVSEDVYTDRIQMAVRRDVSPAVFEDVADVAENQEGREIAWSDVEKQIGMREWGVLIREGIVVESGDRLVVPYPSMLREVDSEPGRETNSEFSLSVWDRVGLGIVGVFAGAYAIPSVLGIIGSALDVVFGGLDVVLPFYAVVGVLAMLTAVYSSAVRRVVSTGTVSFAETAKLKELYEQRLEAERKTDETELAKVEAEQAEMMSDQVSALAAEFKPLIWVFVGTMPVIVWISWSVSIGQVAAGEASVVYPMVGKTEWSAVFVFVKAWIVWYFLCSLVASQSVRRGIQLWKVVRNDV